ncbi:MAG: hypothetical protein ACT6FC_06825 [Methanosarcinaceae archaeon]
MLVPRILIWVIALIALIAVNLKAGAVIELAPILREPFIIVDG